MANPISDKMQTGTIGELLVQLRLLQYNIQAAPPLKDSGNDLIAIKRNIFKAIQVKTSKGTIIRFQKLPKIYHILALVYLKGPDNNISLDKSKIFFLSNEEVTKKSYKMNELGSKELNLTRASELFDM